MQLHEGPVPVQDHWLFVVSTLQDCALMVDTLRQPHLNQRGIVFLCPFHEFNTWADARGAEGLEGYDDVYLVRGVTRSCARMVSASSSPRICFSY